MAKRKARVQCRWAVVDGDYILLEHIYASRRAAKEDAEWMNAYFPGHRVCRVEIRIVESPPRKKARKKK